MKKLKIISIPDYNNTIWYYPLLGEVILWDGTIAECGDHGTHPQISFDSFSPEQLDKLDGDVVSYLTKGKESESYGLRFYINQDSVLECTEENILAIIIFDLENEVK